MSERALCGFQEQAAERSFKMVKLSTVVSLELGILKCDIIARLIGSIDYRFSVWNTKRVKIEDVQMTYYRGQGSVDGGTAACKN